MLRRKAGPEPPQLCPECEAQVIFKADAESLKIFNLDGSPHRCSTGFEVERTRKTAFGEALQDTTIVGFKLRDRRLQLELNGDRILEVYAVGGAPLKLQLTTPEGILRE